MTQVQTYRGEIGEATICQVRTAANPLGECWHVQAETADGERRDFYHGPNAEAADAALGEARAFAWAD